MIYTGHLLSLGNKHYVICAGHVAWMGEIRNTQKKVGGESFGK